LFEKHFPEFAPAEFMKPDIDEKAIRRDKPEDMVVAIAEGKADELVPKLAGREVLLVTMDQVVACGGKVLEKPETEKQAREYLAMYGAGNGASCVNGMVVHNLKTGKRVLGVDISTVHFRAIPDAEVDRLVGLADIYTTAGALLIEETAPHIERIDGSEDSVQGLPVRRLREMLGLAVAPAVSHILFDMDGLLLDTESAYTIVQQKIVGRWGKTFTWDLKAKMMGKKALDAAKILIDELSLEGKISAEDFVSEREAMLDEFFAKAALLPGVEKLIRHLHKHQVPMAVATSSHRRHFELKTSQHTELFGLMHHIVTGDQVPKSKPAPDIFLTAASQFDGGAPPSSQVLVFEDAPNGVEAAVAAGMQVCHVPDPNLSADLRGHADCELTTLEHFRPEHWGLPPFPSV